MTLSGKNILWLALPCAVAAVIVVCGICGNRKNGRNGMAPISTRHRPALYAPPSPPSVISDTGERNDYLALHYWDAFPMGDTTYIGATETTEQALTDYLRILARVQPQTASAGLNKLLDKALDGDLQMFAHFARLLEHYLYRPDSPLRNDRWYVGVLRHIVASPRIGGIYKIRPNGLLETALRNQPGDTASDFAYIMYEGTRGSLHTVRAEYILLVFYDPECSGCRETIDRISGSALLNSLTADHRKLTVMAVYTGKDTGLWERHKGELPEHWIVCRDAGGCISSGRLYDLRAVPSLYLLGKDKRVILRDATPEAVTVWLENRTSL